jgi:hypothetical protein
MLAQELAIAHGLLQNRSFGEAAPLYLQAIHDTPEVSPAWEGLLASLAGLGMADEAVALVETRQQRFKDGLSFYFNALARMIASGLADIGRTLIVATPDNSLLCIVARYFSGMIELHGGRPSDAAAHFAAAGVMAEKFAVQFWSDPFLCKIVTEGPLFQDFAALGELMARDRAEIIAEAGVIAPVAEFHTPSGGEAPFVVCAGMNEAYFDRFGAEAIAAAEAALGEVSGAAFHFHIVDPTPALDEKIVRLRELAPSLRIGLSTETYRHAIQGYGRAEYYACARFLRAPEMMVHYRAPLMIVDADMAWLAHAAHVMTSFGNGSYGCFEQHWQFPSNICHASLVAVGAGAAAHRFADLAAKLIVRRVVSHPFWMLDQLSLLVASRYLMTADPEFRAVGMAEAAGLSFDACFMSSGTAKEKQAMRKAAIAA